MSIGNTTELSLASITTGRRHVTAASIGYTLQHLLPERQLLWAVLGPLAALAIWLLPLGLEPMAHRALAIVSLMLVYWMTEVLDYGVTALLGCYLFWTLGSVKFSVAFSGFASSTPWFVLGVILLGQAAATTGLAERLGFSVIRRIGVSSGKVLFGLFLIVWMLSFLIPSPNALFAILAPLAIGIITTLGVSPQSNTAKGLFVGFSTICSLVSKSLLGSGGTALAYGIIAEQTGIHIWWSQWLVAFLPASVLSIVVCYLAVRWLYPPEVPAVLPGGNEPALAVAFPDPGAWTPEQKKTLAWMLLAMVLWATDFLHHLDPACVAIGVGLGITLPRVGVLDTKAFKQTNFLLIFFIAGALSMSRVLADTHAIDTLMGSFTSWTAPLLTNAWSGSMALYWSAFFYHFGFAGDQVLTAATLSPVLGMAQSLGYNPVTIGLLWTFATGAKLFVYQSAVIAVAATYLYFDVKAFLKISAVMTVAQALILLLLVPLYWPLIGLPWRTTPEVTPTGASAVTAAPVVTTAAAPRAQEPLLPVATAPVVTPLPSGLYIPGTAALHTAGVSGVQLPLTWAQIERQPHQFDWRSLEQHPAFVSAVRAGKQVGLQVEIQGSAGKPAVPAWAQVPPLDVATGSGPRRR